MKCLFWLGTFLMAVTASAHASSGFSFPPDSKIHQIISKRIENDRQGVGIVVGLVGPAGRRIITHGNFGITDFRPIDANTVFEIGSVTKTFTALLLTDAIQRNEMALTDRVEKYLTEVIGVPQRGGKEITLVDLATHTSGLPKMPDNFSHQTSIILMPIIRSNSFTNSFRAIN